MSLIIKNEIKKALQSKYIIAFVFIALILQVFLQFGKIKYLENIENRKSLQNSERAKVSHYEFFRQYATFGVNLMFIPSHFAILFNDSTFELLISQTNIADTFDIDSPKKGKELFDDNSQFLNFMGVSLLFIFYFGIYFGKDTTFKTDYLKFLSSRSGTKNVLCFIIFFRFILLISTFLLMFLINLSVLLINNINLFNTSLLRFLWGLFLVIFFSFAIGCFLGTVKSSFRRNTAFFALYVVSVILLSLLLNFFNRIQASDIKPIFDFDIENLATVMSEEEILAKKYVVLPLNEEPSIELKKDARQSIFNQSEKIMKNLERLKAQLTRKIKARKFVAALFPTLFYFSICEDASTNSYDCFIDFFSFSEMRKQGFVEFCVDQIYPMPDPVKIETQAQGQQSPGNSKAGQGVQGQGGQGGQGDKTAQSRQPVRDKIESFIKDNEDLFFAKSKLPGFFWLGSILSLLWIAGFLVPSYRRTLKELKGEPGEIRNFDVDMKKKKVNYLLTADKGLKSQVNNSLSGDGFSSVNIKVDGNIIKNTDFLFVYEIKQFLKDVDQGCLYNELFNKKMKGDQKPWKFIIQYAEKNNVFLLLDNFFKGMDVNEIQKFIEDVKQSGINILYMGDDFFQSVFLEDNLIFCRDDISISGIEEIIKTFLNNK